MTEVLYAHGGREVIEDNPSLETIQSIVEGTFEIMGSFGGGFDFMLVNDEARLHGLPLNLNASNIAGQPIRGNAIVTDTLK